MKQEVIAGFLEAMPQAGVLVDQTERFIGANKRGLDLLGSQIMGRHFATILRQPSVTGAIEKCLADRGNRSAKHLSNDGAQDTTYEVSLRYVDGIGAVEGGAVLITFTDVTEREQANQMRRDFVANVSHELRTPLTALMGFIETLRGAARDDPNARDRFLSIMEAEASRMNRLVGDLLSLNRVESKERIRPREEMDLVAHLTSTLKTMQPLAESGNVTLNFTPPQDPVMIIGDPDQLLQVFINLVENAIKYGGDTVEISLELLDRDPSLRSSAVKVCVTDNGPGIDPIHLPRLTERFYRADSHRSREMGGTGLGLAIVKHIVNRHRGRLKVESVLGQGTSFAVTLPLN
jgi:two-component system phosphate regulon sensor histidine kinase PhoR